MTTHWSDTGFSERFFAAIDAAGLDKAALTIDTLAPGDHIHAMGFVATKALAQAIEVPSHGRILDIGAGLGGPARYLAQRFQCQVSGIDITPEWVAVAQQLNVLTGFDDRVDFSVGDGSALPYKDQQFDAVVCQHVTMNIANRQQLFHEVFRVLKPGGCLVMSEQGLGINGQPRFPVPWSTDGTHSFLLTPSETEGVLVANGFRIAWIEQSAEQDLSGYTRFLAQIQAGTLPPFGSHIALGDAVLEKIQNAADNIRNQHIMPFLLLAHRP